MTPVYFPPAAGDATRAASALLPWEELHRYWLSKHVGDRPPSRSEIDPPIDIPRLIAHLAILDIIPGGYRYRLYGSAIVYRHGKDMTGKILSSHKAYSETITKLRSALDAVAASQKPRMLITYADDAHIPSHVLLALPLVPAGGKTAQILAGFFYNDRAVPGTPIVGVIAVET
jgi:hypothetical protein